MKFRILFFGLILSFFSTAAMAGGGHNHGHSHVASPVNQATATTKAKNIIAGFVEKNKLDKSWATVTALSVEKKTFKGNAEWLAIFVNDKISNKEKQKIYVFLTLSGDYLAVNYTGK